MDGLRTEADAETDAVFPAEWLRAQQQQIARRIEHLGHAARVISFPGRLVTQQMATGVRLRVLAVGGAAAAAGLFVGVGGRHVLRRAATTRRSRQRSVARAAPTPRPPRRPPAGRRPSRRSHSTTDAFLSELERALGGPQTPRADALDALTPHVREISLRCPVR